ncbi:MAG: four helix bundle protein [Ignavibacteriales bacterium]|nr:four helix bundle protein [Ignavibacteriales bacterium]
MNTFLLDVMDFHELPTWKEARVLALTLHRSSKSFPDRERSGDLAKRIQESCLSLLTTLVMTFDSSKAGVGRDAQRKAKESVEQLEQLVQQAKADGLLTTPESRQLDLEFQIIKKSIHV